MTHDTIVRTLAVVAAVALLAAPYWQHIAALAAEAVGTATKHRAALGRFAAAGLLIAAAWGKVPLPKVTVPTAVTVKVETPSVEMQALVAPIAAALAPLPATDRMLWAATWQKAGLVVAGDALSKEVAFTDTRSLRLYTTLAVDIAWRRIGGKPPGSVDGLRTAVEEAYNTALGLDVVPVDQAMRDRYEAFASAVAWAGFGRE